MDAISTIAVSDTSIRIVLTAERVVYLGRWELAPIWFDIRKWDVAYRHEFEVLARWYRFKQTGQNGVWVFENCKVA